MFAKSKKLTPPPPPITPAEITTRPTRVGWSIDDLLAKDGHRVSVYFTCSIAVVDEPAEQKLLAEVFANPGSLTTAQVIAHFRPPLASAAQNHAANSPAENLLPPEAKPQWIDMIRTAARELAFSCGLEVLAPFDVQVTSPTLQRDRLEQMQRNAAQRRSTDRADQFTQAVDLLRQWESLKSAIPSVTPGKLLEQINPADRGSMLQTLLMGSASNTAGKIAADLWAVSGQSLVRIDTTADTPQPKVISLPTQAGPLRSVRSFEQKLLIGARNGVLWVDPANPDLATVYCHSALSSEHGFSSVIPIGDHLWGCHREGGLVGWKIGDLKKPATVISVQQLGSEPRHLVASGLFATGKGLRRISSTGKLESILQMSEPIVAILETDSAVIVADQAGQVLQLEKTTLEKTGEIQTPGRLGGAALLPWMWSFRLLLNRAEGAIDCVGLEDQLVTQFSMGQTPLRAVTACAAKVAAMTSDRQRIVLWNPWDGRKPAVEIYLMGITHHRIADLAFN